MEVAEPEASRADSAVSCQRSATRQSHREHPEVGVRMHAGIPSRMSDTPCEVRRAAPVLGQDNDYVYGELLGMSGDQIAELKARQVIY